ADDHLRLSVAQDELPLLLELLLVHRHERRPEPIGGVAGDGPLDAVVGDDPHHVATAHAQVGEPAAKRVHHLAELAIGDPGPRAVPLHTEELAVLEFAAAPLAELDEVLELHRHGSLLARPVLRLVLEESTPERNGGRLARGTLAGTLTAA